MVTSPDSVLWEGPYTHSFVHARSTRLHIAEAGDPHAPLIILLHDAFGAWFDYARALPELAQQGLRAVAVDMRGYGASDKPPSISMREHVSDIAGLIPALGTPSATVVGVDSGAVVGWLLASHYPERVTSLVSVAGAHPVDLRRAMAARPWDFTWLLSRAAWVNRPMRWAAQPKTLTTQTLNFLRLNTTMQFQRSDEFARLTEARTEAITIGSVPPGMLATARGLVAPPALRDITATIDAPVLMMHAPQPLWGPLDKRAAARTSCALDSVALAGTKNLPHIERPDAFAGTVADWLR